VGSSDWTRLSFLLKEFASLPRQLDLNPAIVKMRCRLCLFVFDIRTAGININVPLFEGAVRQ
jgi:hypothetical protein